MPVNALTEEIEQKADLIRTYQTRTHALFHGGEIPIVPEIFFFPAAKPTLRKVGASDGDPRQTH